MQRADSLYQFRNYILESLIERGYKYIARDSEGSIYVYSDKPIKRDWCWFGIDTDYGKSKNISLVSSLFTDIEWKDEEPFEIPCVNWDSVPVDTKVIVTGLDGSEWKCHFCKKYDWRTVLVFRDGKTSWTATKTQDIDIRRVRLA